MTTHAEESMDERIIALMVDVRAGQARLEEQVGGINRRLDTLNGTVARHQLAIQEMDHRVADHEKDAAATAAASAATESANARWAKRLQPVVYGAAGVGLALTATHAPELLKLLARIP